MKYRIMVKISLFFCLLLQVQAVQGASSSVLKEWEQWIEDRHEDISCPWMMTNNNQRVCEWPGRLIMRLSPNGLDFSFDIDIFSKYAQVQLPGNLKQWPSDITVNNKLAAVVEKNNTPYISLTSGKHVVKGKFSWKTKPSSLTVPLAIAFVQLYEAGRSIPTNRRNGEIIFAQQRLPAERRKRDGLKVEVYRLLSDGVPLMLETRLKLSVSGKPREIRIGKVALKDTITVELVSDLPARVESDGDMRLQVVAGEHNVRIASRFVGNPTSIAIEPHSVAWPQYEYISFKSNTNLRQTTLSGAISIDTTQHSIPQDWQDLPTYRLDKETVLSIDTEFRGDHAPVANQLKVSRDLWLDFDGQAITALDNIEGKMFQQWRLNALADTQIGRATVADQPVLITRDNDKQGIEIRSPDISLRAVTRVASPSAFSASGWDARADTFSATLHLPPGWRVLHANGVDDIYGTWISQWDLWDIFLLLMIVFASRKLSGLYTSILAAVTFVVIYHENGAPIVYYPLLLLVLALLPILKGRIRKMVISSGVIVSVLLLVSVLAFAVSSFRLAIYPTLEKSQLGRYQQSKSLDYASSVPAAIAVKQLQRIQVNRSGVVEKERFALQEDMIDDQGQGYKNMYEVDENDRVQTGPGLPTWTWNSIRLQSSSPVTSEQSLLFFYCSPFFTGLWRVLSVFLVMAYSSLLIMQLVRLIKQRPPGDNASNMPVNTGLNSTMALILLVLTGALMTPFNGVYASDYPPEFLLKELETKLLKAPKCLPHCVSLNNGNLLANKSEIVLSFDVYADADVSMPIPSGRGAWLPSSITVDAKQKVPAREQYKHIEIFLNKGHHTVTLKGPISGDQITIAFPLPIHNVSARSKQWIIEGLVDGRILNNSLSLRSKAKSQDDKTDSLIPDPIAPMVLVQREFILGKQWKLSTRVTRMAPNTGAITVNVPLLEYEKVLSDSVNIKESVAQLQFRHNQREITWLSSIEPMQTLTLIAQDNPRYIETWRFRPSSLWRIHYEGIPPIKEANDVSSLQPLWTPWPNEQLNVEINRPTGIQGPTHTIEKASLSYEAGKRIQKSMLKLEIRSSLGEDYELTLPEGAEVLSLKLNGAQLNLPAANSVKVPLQPGQQVLDVEFQEQRALGLMGSSPSIRIPGGATNIDITYSLPKDRWPLYITGPAIGPAMLYWGMLCVIIIGAIGLSILARKLTLDVPVTLIGWLLLGVGLSTVNSYGVLVVASFFFLLAVRKQHIQPERMSRRGFNSMQCLIVVWTIVTAIVVISAIPIGLLSNPDMKVVGNDSYSHLYRFYQDRADWDNFPSVQVLSVSLFSYRAVMMLWSLWLASRIIRWAAWWWGAYSAKGAWITVKDNKSKNGER